MAIQKIYDHKFKIILVVATLLLAACNGPVVPTPQPASPIPETTQSPTVSSTSQPTPTDTPTPVVEVTATPTDEIIEPTVTVRVEPPVISVNNLDQLQEVDAIEFELPEALDWSQDSHTLAILSRNEVLLYSVANRAESRSIAFGPEIVLDACADNGMAATTEDQKNIRFYDTETGSIAYTIETQGILYQASFSPDGRRVAIPLMEEIAVELYDTETGQLEQRLTGFETAAPVYGAVFSTNGENIIWISRGQVQPMHIESGELGPSFGHQDFVSAVALSPDESVLAVSTAGTVNDEYTPIIQLWDPESGDDLGILLPGDEIPSAMDIAPASDLLVNSFGFEVQFWDLHQQSQITSLNGHSDRVVAAVFSPDGRTLATASADGMIRLWQIAP